MTSADPQRPDLLVAVPSDVEAAAIVRRRGGPDPGHLRSPGQPPDPVLKSP